MAISVVGTSATADPWVAPSTVTPTAATPELWIVVGTGAYGTCSLTIDSVTPHNQVQYDQIAIGWDIVAAGSHTVSSNGVGVGVVRCKGYKAGNPYLDYHTGSYYASVFQAAQTLETEVGGIMVAVAGRKFYPDADYGAGEAGSVGIVQFATTKPCDLHAFGGSGHYKLTTAASSTDALDITFWAQEDNVGIGMSFSPGAAAASPVWW